MNATTHLPSTPVPLVSRWAHQPRIKGQGLALLACVLILADTTLMIATGLWVFFRAGFDAGAIQHLFATTPLPFMVYVVWLAGVFASVAAVVAIVLYDFRERWFWRCLLVASVAWLAFPPVHALIGVGALILLLACRDRFPRRDTSARH